jgi:hypothetical protein
MKRGTAQRLPTKVNEPADEGGRTGADGRRRCVYQPASESEPGSDGVVREGNSHVVIANIMQRSSPCRVPKVTAIQLGWFAQELQFALLAEMVQCATLAKWDQSLRPSTSPLRHVPRRLRCRSDRRAGQYGSDAKAVRKLSRRPGAGAAGDGCSIRSRIARLVRAGSKSGSARTRPFHI